MCAMRPPEGSLPWYVERCLMLLGVAFDDRIAKRCWSRGRSVVDCARVLALLQRWRLA